MRKPTLTIKRKGPDIRANLRNARGQFAKAYVTVGVQRAEGQQDYEGTDVTVAQVALWNEFGTPNAEHPTPERSFMRSTMRENRGLIEQWRKEALLNVITKGWTVEKALTMVGYRMVVLVQNKIKSNIPPENAPWTLERKERLNQGTNTLIATGKLLRSIGFQVHVSGNAAGGTPNNNSSAG